MSKHWRERAEAAEAETARLREELQQANAEIVAYQHEDATIPALRVQLETLQSEIFTVANGSTLHLDADNNLHIIAAHIAALRRQLAETEQRVWREAAGMVERLGGNGMAGDWSAQSIGAALRQRAEAQPEEG